MSGFDDLYGPPSQPPGYGSVPAGPTGFGGPPIDERTLADQAQAQQQPPPQPQPSASEAPPPGTEGRRDEDPPLADFALAMTKSMLRTGYYSRTHPEGQRALLGLFDGLMNLMHERGVEINFQLSFSRGDRETEDVALYDGKSEIKLMRDLLTDGAASTFVPKLVDYFHRQGLLSFSVSRDITQPHFEIFIERMTRPQAQDVKHPGEELSRDLARSGVRGVSVVFDEDRIQSLRGSIPWRAELALTRLRKDLRMIPLLANATVDELRKIKSRLMDDILRGIQQPALIVALARYLGEALQGQEQMMSRDEAEHHLVGGITEAILPGVAARMARPWTRGAKDEVDESAEDRRCRARLIQMMIRRLLSLDGKKAAHALVVLYENGYIDLDNLPANAVDLIRAHALAEAALSSPEKLFQEMNHANAPDPFGAAIRDVELALDVILEWEKWETASALVDLLWRFAKGFEAVPAGGAERAIQVLTKLGEQEEITSALAMAMCSPRGPHDACVRIARALEPEDAIRTLVEVLARTEDPHLRRWTIDEITRRAWDAPRLISAAVTSEKTPWFVTRNLLGVIRRVGDENDYPAVAQLFEHNKPQVRSEALNTMTVLSPKRAMRIIKRALDDEDAEMRRAAALAVAMSHWSSDDVVVRLLQMLHSDREPEGVRLQVAATLGAIAALGDEVPRRKEILDGLRNIIADKHGPRLHRLKRFAANKLPPPPHLLAAVCAALGAVGEMIDEELLRACVEDESPDVREAATHALGRLRASGSMPPPAPAQGVN